ncbi:MAG: circularly permuted type 2 ATP-grasp protein [Acidobacteria bacterium]|nr:circularly permuted type 2 ATP-grasp protein [Acidobacteriota bacterium]
MIASLRNRFNGLWNPAGYSRFLATIERECGMPVPFRLNETPFFLPRELAGRLAAAGTELIRQLSTPAYRAAADRSVPDRYHAPGEPPNPLFLQVDFGLLRESDGSLGARLVEIQAFPSLYAFQPVLARAYIEAYGLDPGLEYLMSGLDAGTYGTILRQAILAGHGPADVVLLEIDPLHQKTLPDFVLTERLCGIRTVCITEVEKRGNRLFHGGREIRRIYNRTIVDELERKGTRLNFDFRDELDVEWAGHPNFYFRISKFSLPFLRHPTVPGSWFLSGLTQIPDDLENYVLKPLYSFAGLGVKIGPTREDIAAITQPDQYILQERVHFTPLMDTPHGPAKVEVRVMYIWPEGGEPTPVCNIVRTGRGKMMGVDHNKDLEWVGATAALIA